MANNCDTTYKILGTTKDLKELESILEDSSSLSEAVFKLTGKDSCARGSIIDWYLDTNPEAGAVLEIYQDTAWCEQKEFRLAIEERFKDCKVYYSASEPGCEVFESNDVNHVCFNDKYVTYAGCEEEYWNDDDEFLRYINSLNILDKCDTVDDVFKQYELFKDHIGRYKDVQDDNQLLIYKIDYYENN